MGGEVLSCLRSLTYNYKVLPLTAKDQLLCVGLTTGQYLVVVGAVVAVCLLLGGRVGAVGAVGAVCLL